MSTKRAFVKKKSPPSPTVGVSGLSDSSRQSSTQTPSDFKPTGSFVRSLRLTNLLSFDGSQEIKLGRLNVLIGPNGSGKSNLLEALSLLRACPGDLSEVFAGGGSFDAWVYKHGSGVKPVRMEAEIELAETGSRVRHSIELRRSGMSYEVVKERIEDLGLGYAPSQKTLPLPKADPIILDYANGVLRVPTLSGPWANGHSWAAGNRSVLASGIGLSQPASPVIASLSKAYIQMLFYRDWFFGRVNPVRLPQSTDLTTKVLFENAQNLCLVLNSLKASDAFDNVLSQLRHLYPAVQRVELQLVGGYAQLVIIERDGVSIPASRLSDGTIRFLALLTVLYQPAPPPIVCIEEPELGLHPDIQVKLAEILIDASKRMQLVVTTHSEMLIGALSELPESVMVCEKENGATLLRRLASEKLGKWLKDYSLGELWMQGQIGGTRW